MNRLLAVTGVAAPASFIGGWLVAGARAHDYRPVRDAISELARVGAPTRTVMTAGFVSFGLLALPWARTLATALREPRLGWSVGLAALSTLAVAALPLGGPVGDGAHAAAAGLGYVGMAASPLLGARRLAGPARLASYAVGLVSALSLLGSLGGRYDGGFQRLGLTVVDGWFAVLAIALLRRRAA